MNEQHNPWKILAVRKVYANQWINVTEYDVINPAGGKGIYGKVHFRNHAVGIVPLDEDLNVYLIGQFRFPLEQYSWEIPEGGGPINTNILDAAKRELKEETGLVAEEWTTLLKLHLSNSVTDEGGTIFLARKLKQEEASPEDTEHLAVKKLSFNEAYRMMEDGIITDSLTVTALLKVKVMLLEGSLN